MLKMAELMDSKSRKVRNCVVLTVCFRARECLLMVETRSWDVQQTFGMARRLWIGLEHGNQFATFLDFFETCFVFYTPLIPLFFIWNCTLCTLEVIKLQICFKYFPIKIIDSWFDHGTKSFQIKPKCNLLCPCETCTIWFHLQLYNRPKHA